MMAPKRQDLSSPRSPRREKRKQAGMSRYLILFLVLIAVVTGLVLVLSTSKKGGSPRQKTATSDEFSTGARRKSGRTSAAKAEKLAKRKREKKQKRVRRERKPRRKKNRVRVGGSSRGRYAVPRQLQMIVTNAKGERVAVIDSKQYRAGDEVEGRKLTQVKTDEVMFEYRGRAYSARIGQQLY